MCTTTQPTAPGKRAKHWRQWIGGTLFMLSAVLAGLWWRPPFRYDVENVSREIPRHWIETVHDGIFDVHVERGLWTTTVELTRHNYLCDWQPIAVRYGMTISLRLVHRLGGECVKEELTQRDRWVVFDPGGRSTIAAAGWTLDEELLTRPLPEPSPAPQLSVDAWRGARRGSIPITGPETPPVAHQTEDQARPGNWLRHRTSDGVVDAAVYDVTEQAKWSASIGGFFGPRVVDSALTYDGGAVLLVSSLTVTHPGWKNTLLRLDAQGRLRWRLDDAPDCELSSTAAYVVGPTAMIRHDLHAIDHVVASGRGLTAADP